MKIGGPESAGGSPALENFTQHVHFTTAFDSIVLKTELLVDIQYAFHGSRCHAR